DALALVGAPVAVETAGALPVQHAAGAAAGNQRSLMVDDGRAAVDVDTVAIAVNRRITGAVECRGIFAADGAEVLDLDGACGDADRVSTDAGTVMADNGGAGEVVDHDVGGVDVADVDAVLRALDPTVILDRVVGGGGRVDAHA